MTLVMARTLPPTPPPVVAPRRDRNNVNAFIHDEGHWDGGKRFWDKAWTQRLKGQTAGSHVLDRCDLRKAILLCSNCRKKFDAKKEGYVRKKNIPSARGQCDGCLQIYMKEPMPLFVHHTIVSNL